MNAPTFGFAVGKGVFVLFCESQPLCFTVPQRKKIGWYRVIHTPLFRQRCLGWRRFLYAASGKRRSQKVPPVG